MTNIVELKNLTVNYKPNKEVDKQLIHGIDINFRKGHITGVVGESGSGKSILMRSIMSILPNNIFDKNDKFFFDGKEVKSGEKLPISMIFQNPMTSWGTLLQNAQQSLQRAPHMAIIPGLFVMLTIYSFNNIGNLLTKYIQKEGE